MLLNSDIVDFKWKTNEGEGKSIVLLFFVIWRRINRRCLRVVGLGRKSCFGSAKIASFSGQDFSRRNKHDTFWHFVSPGYLYVLFV